MTCHAGVLFRQRQKISSSPDSILPARANILPLLCYTSSCAATTRGARQTDATTNRRHCMHTYLFLRRQHPLVRQRRERVVPQLRLQLGQRQVALLQGEGAYHSPDTLWNCISVNTCSGKTNINTHKHSVSHASARPARTPKKKGRGQTKGEDNRSR